MKKRTFLQKFTGQSLEPPDSDLAVSIRYHLKLLLNCRQGMAPHIPDFGIPDIHYIYYSLPRSLEELSEDIKASIVKYEPRITNVHVELVETGEQTFCATYRIIAELVDGSRVSNLTFTTQVRRDGQSDTLLDRGQ